MKKLLSLIAVAIVASAAWAQPKTVTFDFYNNPGVMGFPSPADGRSAAITTPVTYQGVTVVGTNQTVIYNDEDEFELRIYANNSVTFSVEEGFQITKIAVTGQMANYAGYLSADVGTYTSPNWTGEEQVVTFTARTTGKYDKFVVTYEEVPTTAINDINGAEVVASTRYYNLAGQQSATPFDGVNVVVKTMADGTQSVSKIMK